MNPTAHNVPFRFTSRLLRTTMSRLMCHSMRYYGADPVNTRDEQVRDASGVAPQHLPGRLMSWLMS